MFQSWRALKMSLFLIFDNFGYFPAQKIFYTLPGMHVNFFRFFQPPVFKRERESKLVILAIFAFFAYFR
jgi:hypothetical protein